MSNTFFKNSAILSLGRFGAKALGIVSTLIVARLLAPEDYGIIAAAMIMQDFANRFQNIGFAQNIITRSTSSYSFLDTIFFVKLLFALVVSCALFFSADFLTLWVNIPEAATVLKVICWILLIQSFTNLSVILNERDKNFVPTIKVALLSKFISIFITIGLAYFIGNYWALALGMLSAAMLEVIFSYCVVKSYVPTRFDKQYLSEIFNFSKWIFFRQMAEFANIKIPHIIFGKYFSGAFLGYFTMVESLANMFAQEVSASFDKANLSSLSRQLARVDDRQEKLTILVDNAGKMFRIKDIIIIPFYMICFFYSELVIGSLLGAQWLPTAVIFSALCIRAIFLSYRLSIITILTSLRFTKASFYVSFSSMCVHLLSAIAAVRNNDPMLLVYGSVLSNFLTLALSLYLFRLHTGMMLWSATIGTAAVSITLAFVGLLFIYSLGTELYSLVCFFVFILIFVYVLKIKFKYEEASEFIKIIAGAYKKIVSNVR